MDERDRPRGPNELHTPGLGNPLSLGGDADGGSVTVDAGVYREQMPLGGRTVGEIRRAVGPRYGIDPDALAIVAGAQAGDDIVVRTGQEVRFLHIGGEKGQNGALEELLGAGSFLQQALGMHRRLRQRKPPKIVIEGDVVTTTSPEGHKATMGLSDMLARLNDHGPSSADHRDLIVPDGVKCVVSRRDHVVLVHQTSPVVHNLKWIARGSRARHGPDTEYRQVRIALPYLLIFAMFEPRRDGKLRLGGSNEAFFRTEPLRSPDDRLCFPALLNCSKFDSSSRPLSWICTQHLERTRVRSGADVNERVRQGLCDLKHCMLETGFNESSEEHEISSWYTESKSIDSRISTIERWEEATAEDPMFVHEVPWLRAGMSVRQIAERMLTRQAGRGDRPRTSRDLSRVLFNHGSVQKAIDDAEEGSSE